MYGSCERASFQVQRILCVCWEEEKLIMPHHHYHLVDLEAHCPDKDCQ